MPILFEPLTLRGVTLKNRIGVSPMCQYSSDDGCATDWHFVHLGARAVGGAGLVIAEATAVEARGRISPQDAGLWNDAQIEPLARINAFVKAHGAVPGIQIAHAGRKAGTVRPWEGSGPLSDENGGWQPVGPSPLPFADGWRTPTELSQSDIAALVRKFTDAAKRAETAGYQLIELHAAHGYLAHEFLSPLSNHRTDEYGGAFENRIRFLRETVQAVRRVWPENLPLAVRLSCTDWTDGGWTLEESIALSRLLKMDGVDLIDCSSGGNVPHASIPIAPGYQVPFAEAIKRGAEICIAAVGLITDPVQADAIIRDAQADIVLLARESLREPNWPLHAAKALGLDPNALCPAQYARAF